MYNYYTKIKLHETDAAGRLFFSQQFKLMHDAYESFLQEKGIGFAVMLKQRKFFLPIVHAQADFKKPLFVGDQILIEVTLAHLGQTSFRFAYQLKNDANEIVGTGTTVHVTVSKSSAKKIPLPPEIKKALKSI